MNHRKDSICSTDFHKNDAKLEIYYQARQNSTVYVETFTWYKDKCRNHPYRRLTDLYLPLLIERSAIRIPPPHSVQP